MSGCLSPLYTPRLPFMVVAGERDSISRTGLDEMLQDDAGCLAYGLGCPRLHSGIVPLSREGAKTSSRAMATMLVTILHRT